MAKVEELLKTLSQAMQVETDGYNFYKIAAEKTTDEQGREIFDFLAEEEVKHLKMLKEQYNKLKKTGELKFDENEFKRKEFDLSKDSPIFSEEFKQRLKQHNFEISALSIGTLLEKNSIEFYEKCARENDDNDVKALFLYLKRWEEEHLKALIDQQRFLREERWHDAQFYPF